MERGLLSRATAHIIFCLGTARGSPIDLHFPTIRKRHVVSVDNFVVTLQQCLSEVLNEAHRQNVLKAC